MTLLALDPGPTRSALVVLVQGVPMNTVLESNDYVCGVLHSWAARDSTLVVEQVQSYGMSVGAEVFETCVWTGRFVEAWARGTVPLREWHRLPRRAVKLHLCGQARAKDSNIRQALIDRYGGKEQAIGRKANPGPLYGIKADLWQALALGISWQDGVRS